MSTSGGTSGGSGGTASAVARSWSSDPGSPGFMIKGTSNYTPGTNASEAVYFESSAGGTMQRTYWLNENNVPRTAASKPGEVTFKVHGHAGGDQTADVQQWLTEWSGTILAGINNTGMPVIGPNRVLGAWTIILAAGDPVPDGLPAGTIIGRTAA